MTRCRICGGDIISPRVHLHLEGQEIMAARGEEEISYQGKNNGSHGEESARWRCSFGQSAVAVEHDISMEVTGNAI